MSLTPHEAFEWHMKFDDKAVGFLLKGVVVSLVCLGTKLLDFQVSGIELPGLKISLANARILTGILGWLLLFLVSMCIANTVLSFRFGALCEDLHSQVYGTTGISQIYMIPYGLMFILCGVAIIFALVLVYPDMFFLLETVVLRFFGLQPFIGNWDTCIVPSPTG